MLLSVAFGAHAYAQVKTPADTSQEGMIRKQEKPVDTRADLSKQYDFGDMLNDILRPKRKADSTRKRSAITVVPNIAANPTIGFQIGIKAVAGKVLGNVPHTYMSTAATSASITTKGILYFYFLHNIFTPGNKWNLQGSIVASKSVTPDFGLGIGQASNKSPEDYILTNPERKPYVWHSEYYKFFEKVYKEIGHNLFLGAGVEFEMRRHLNNPKYDSILTPFEIYNERYGFPQDHYVASGFLFNVQYTTRDNPNRAYKGVYIDGGFRVNQTWVGSSKNSLQFTYDFRKYFSLSARTPEHVIAFWSWGSGVVAGAVPYLELPGTTRDPSFRSGRGYTGGYFKSTQFFYSETEYRFPITRNKLFSGVTFVNIESANDKSGTRLFEVWQPAAGLGLRVLFNKATRTNLCLDYAWGRYGTKGFFLNLNETF
ncbi:BamA/TamA family outer membrane protein [Chitinophaga agrisoli]|uniref:BamA/TamA family outer membrane protein n=1 Tax=Chitinophaga agrisoli TaxID=2607653 RepID=A0A5B2VZH1_9BACT|nr:BamA/TamA family outer membrane protein [Chitinophaga agrisoli]KAA2243527.1 BamA/TamA family outer membrane protein [Chitinophaga agrisoli]